MYGADESGSGAGSARRRWWQRRWFQLLLVLVLVAGAGLVVTLEYVLHHAEPIVRKRIVETLSARFHAPVELDRLDISLFKGIEVNGWGLRIGNSPGTVPILPNGPMLSVQHFAFRTTVRGLLRQPTHVSSVRVQGMELHIPPTGNRSELQRARTTQADPEYPGLKPRIAFVVDELQCTDLRIFVESAKPGPDHGHKVPLEFDVASFRLRDVGRNRAMPFEAELTNPKPIGQIHTRGHFGPWAGGLSTGEPGDTPLDGDYSFSHADLSSLRGVAGSLSSTGHYAGVLNRLVVDGRADVPNFSLDISNHAMPLQTQFHAIVDGTSGDTYLQPVQARLGASAFTTSGKIVKVEGAGHDIALDVDVPHGRVQDFLRLAAKTNPPLMNGVLSMRAKLHVPPGPERVAEKLGLAGSFSLAGVQFNNPKVQDQVDGLSARAQGMPQEVRAVSRDGRTEAQSTMSANFAVAHGAMEATDVRFTIPGASVQLNGVYSMDGKLFEFRGHVRTEATASQMVGGWKGLLLTPFDHFLQKNGAGVELPIEISGTQGDMHLGLATHGTDATPAQMLTDAREKRDTKQKMDEARREAALAAQEDLEAAHAPTLEAAEKAHAAAVQHRADALRLAQGAATSGPRP